MLVRVFYKFLYEFYFCIKFSFSFSFVNLFYFIFFVFCFLHIVYWLFIAYKIVTKAKKSSFFYGNIFEIAYTRLKS